MVVRYSLRQLFSKSRKKVSPYFVLTLLLASLILAIVLAQKTGEACDTVKTVPTSVLVNFPEQRMHIGFNLNKNNLTFGTLYPGAAARRVITSEYTKDATMYIWAEGDFSSWMVISPRRFEAVAHASQDIEFNVLVPLNAKEGEYKGEVFFCYKDK